MPSRTERRGWRLATLAAPVLTASVVVLAGCSEEGGAPGDSAVPMLGERVSVEGGHYTNITVPELQGMLANKDFPLINVHVPFAGDLPGTDLSIRYDEIENHLDRLPADKGAKIVLYCRTGPMSERAAADLARLGYTNVYNLVDGFTAWVEWGLPLAAP